MGKFRQIFMELSARDTPIFLFPVNNLCKCQVILTKLGTCIDIKEIWVGIANGQISSMFDRDICLLHDNGGVLDFNVLICWFFPANSVCIGSAVEVGMGKVGKSSSGRRALFIIRTNYYFCGFNKV